jgi:hypothetical protein
LTGGGGAFAGTAGTDHVGGASNGGAAGARAGAGAGGAPQNVAGSGAGGADAGAGGESGAPADGGAAGAGETVTSCLAATSFASVFTIADPAFCAVAVYSVAETFGRGLPSWGRHGGPLTFKVDATGGGITFERWALPTGATGSLTKQETHVDALLPDDSFIGERAVDLPFFDWTAISLTGPGVTTKGQIVATKGTSVVQRFALNDAGDFAGVASGEDGRLLYLAESAIGNPLGTVNGFYQADACILPTPDLGAGTGCAAPGPIAGWGDSPGAMAVDHQGNAFAINLSFGPKTQQARGYAASLVQRGAPPSEGATLFTVAGYTQTLAALTPHGVAPGTLVFQPLNATSGVALDVLAQTYTVTAVVVPGSAAPTTFLTLTTPNSLLTLMADSQDRLWVGTTGAASTTFVVLARKAP